MTAVAPRIWRTISRELTFSTIFCRTLPQKLPPRRRTLKGGLHFSTVPRPLVRGAICAVPAARFSTASVWKAQVHAEPKDEPDITDTAAPNAPGFQKVDKTTARTIFGSKIGRQRANVILETLQEQRLAGTLDAGIPDCNERTLAQGLEWLRSNYPLDEDAAIIARLEREEEAGSQESQSLIDRGVKLGLYEAPNTPGQTPPPKQPKVQGAVTYVPQQDTERNRILGTSFIDERKKALKARHEEEQAAKKAEQEAAEAEAVRTGVPIPTPESKALVRQQKVAEKKAEWQEHVRSVFGEKRTDGKDPWPVMSMFQRLWPSTVFTAAVILLSALFAHFYTPPPRKARLWPDVPPAAATMVTIVGINIGVFLLWRVVPLQRTFFKYLMSTPGYPRAFSVIGNTFSHQGFLHLAMNMSVLFIFGTRLHDDIGRGPFLATLFTCAASSSLFSLFIHVFRRNFQAGALGASGIVCGVLAAWCIVNSDRMVKIIFVPPEYSVPSLAFLLFLVGSELFMMRRGVLAGSTQRVDYMAHLGGYGSGIVCGLLINKRMPPRRKQEKSVAKEARPRIVNLPS